VSVYVWTAPGPDVRGGLPHILLRGLSGRLLFPGIARACTCGERGIAVARRRVLGHASGPVGRGSLLPAAAEHQRCWAGWLPCTRHRLGSGVLAPGVPVFKRAL
jgi:hypothetical protein